MPIGVDIENIKRFRKFSSKKNNFLKNIFTEQELDYCFSKIDPASHLAVRFCGKEAVLKAMSSLVKTNLPMNKIEINNNKKGVPKVKILNSKYKHFSISISLSHSKNTAVAFIIIN